MSSSEINVTPFSATDPVKATVTSVGGASAGGTASSNKPTITGTGEPGQVVNLYDGVRWLGSTTVASDGTWSIAAPNALKAGNHSFTAICVGADGVNGLSSEPVSVKVPAESSTIPPTPAIGAVTDHVGPVTGNVASGGSTDDPKPTFTGSGANAGDIITIKDGSTPIGSAIVKPDGTWSVTPDVSLGNGPHSITAVEKNPSTGATSSPSPVYPITVDTAVPAAPVIAITDNVAPVTGNVASGGTTDDSHPTISGSHGKPGDIVTVSDNGLPIGSATVDADGNWSITPVNPLGNGAHSITAVEKNPATGATGPASTAYPITVDTNVPGAPSIGTVVDHTGAIQGNVANGGTTDETKPIINGTGAKSGDIVTVSDNGSVIGSATVGTDGKWSFTPATALANGSHSITATEKNPATGATSPASAGFGFTIAPDVLPAAQTPVISGVADHVGSIQGNIASGGQTDDTKPVVSGTGHAGDIITVSDGGTVLGSTTVASNGTWSFTPGTVFPYGNHVLTAVASGNGQTPSSVSGSYPIVVKADTPTIDHLVDAVGFSQGNVANGGTTDDSNPTFVGHGTPGVVLYLYRSDKSNGFGTVTVASDGTWSMQSTSPFASNGTYTVMVNSTSGGSAGFTFKVAPDLPNIDYLVDAVGPVTGNVASGGTTDDANATLKGTGPANSVFHVYEGNTKLGDAQIDSTGHWSFKLTNVTAGTHTYQGYSDAVSGNSNTFTATFANLALPPVQAPTITGVYDDSSANLSNIPNGGTTTDSTPLIKGTGHPGDLIVIYDGSTGLVGAVVDGYGNWSASVPSGKLGIGSHSFHAIASDQQSSSPSSNYWTVTIGNPVVIPPPALNVPGFQVVDDGTGATVNTGGSTSDSTPNIWGNGIHAGATITIYDSGTAIGSTTVASDGSWSIHPNLATGVHHITAVASQAGYTNSAATGDTYFTVTAVVPPPQTPTITGLWDTYGSQQGNLLLQGLNGYRTDDQQPTLTGTGRPGETIIFSVINLQTGLASAVLGSTVVASNGTWSVQPINKIPYTDAFVLGAVAMNASGQKSAPVKATDIHGNQALGYFMPQAAIDYANNTGRDALEWTSSHQNGYAPWIVDIKSSGNTVIISGRAPLYSYLDVRMDGTAIALGAGPDSSGNFIWTSPIPIPPGMHTFTITTGGNYEGGAPLVSNSVAYNVTSTFDAPVEINRSASPDDAHVAASAHDDSTTTHHAVDANGAFTGTTANETVDLNVDPQSYFTQASAHIAGGGGIDTIALSGSHQILDLTSLTGTTAAAKISGVEVFDLGGHQNTLKVSLLDVLNLGEQDLFVQDGKQQVVVKGAMGDAVDLSNTHVAGVADGQWEQHGTAQVGGVTYAVYEHSGAHVELLVQQGVATTVHQ